MTKMKVKPSLLYQKDGFDRFIEHCIRTSITKRFHFRWLKLRYIDRKRGIDFFDVQPSKMEPQ